MAKPNRRAGSKRRHHSRTGPPGPGKRGKEEHPPWQKGSLISGPKQSQVWCSVQRRYVPPEKVWRGPESELPKPAQPSQAQANETNSGSAPQTPRISPAIITLSVAAILAAIFALVWFVLLSLYET